MNSWKSCTRCIPCGLQFASARRFEKHVANHRRPFRLYVCKLCNLEFTQHKAYDIHINSHRCPHCMYEDSDIFAVNNHILTHIKSSTTAASSRQTGSRKRQNDAYPFKEIAAFKGYVRTYRHRNNKKNAPYRTLMEYFSENKRCIYGIIKQCLNDYKSVKIQITLKCKFIRDTPFCDKEEEEYCTQFINSNMKVVLNKFYLTDVLNEIDTNFQHQIEIFEKYGSGWNLCEILGSDIRVAEFEILRGGCFVSVPEELAGKKAIINPQMQGNKCFQWAFLIGMHINDIKSLHRARIRQYEKFVNNYDWKCIEFPTTQQNIKTFESRNAEKMFAVNVFGFDDRGKLNIKYQSMHIRDKKRKIVNLLYVQTCANNPGHFMYINGIEKLYGSKNHHKRLLCYNCLALFPSQARLNKHEELCFCFKKQRVCMPDPYDLREEPVCRFKKFENKLKSRFVIYSDFEALCMKVKRRRGKIRQYAKHVPSGYCFVVVSNDEVIYKSLYRGKDCMEIFVKELDEICDQLNSLNLNKVPMRNLTLEEQTLYEESNICHICENVLQEDKVRDHSHETGRFRGAAHRQCNAKYRQKDRIPVLMHNFRSYDSHLLLSYVRKLSAKEVKVIPSNSEKYMALLCENYVFLDSFLFLTASLDTLTNDLLLGNNFEQDFKPLIQIFGQGAAKEMSRKGIYMYEYMDKWKKFDQKKFPKKSDFYNSLASSGVSDVDYKYGKHIFKSYCSDLGDYHDLYLMTDTLLLACVFEKFREVALTHYKLDPVHYYSLAGYSWDAALLNTKQVLDLFIDSAMYNTIELGLRGGVSMISTRYASARNKYIRKSGKIKDGDNYLFYIDKNNLYGEALLQHLPTGDFEWEDAEFVQNLTTEEILKWGDEDNIGRILVVDLGYGSALHPKHSEYPLAPEKICVNSKLLSSYQTDLISHYNMTYSEKQPKLVPHLGPRKRYAVHYRNLKYYLKKGMTLEKVHSVIKFSQSAWLKNYVLFNGSLRQQARTIFEQNLFKFIVNSIFGKSAEQVRNREDVRIVSNLEQMKKLTRHSNFKNYQILSPDLVITFLDRAVVKLNKPLYIAFTVLDLSKLFMYEWHYDKIGEWFGERAKFLFTDTDSLAYSITTEDLYEDLAEHADEFDFSNYDQSHFLYSNVNKKVIGKMTDEAKGNVLESFVGVAPKMYSFLGKGIRKKAMKGVKKQIVDKYINHKRFKSVLFKQKKLVCRMNLIRSRHHKLYSGNFSKVALHCFDSKRYILADGINTIAHHDCRIVA